MPMPLLVLNDLVERQEAIQVSIEEGRSAIHSLLLLVWEDKQSGLAEWVSKTRQSMTRAERKTNELVMMGLHYAVIPGERWHSFPAYIDHLAGVDPVALRDKMMDVYERMPQWKASIGECALPVTDPAELLSVEQALESAEHYLTYLRQRFPAASIDETIERSAYQLVAHPEEMQSVIVEHFRNMWRKYLAPEWQRTRPLLQQALQALEQVKLKGLSIPEAARLVTGQELSDEKWGGYFKEAKRLVLVPHPHSGPYVMRMYSGDGTLVLFFGAHAPKGSQMITPDLDRAELLVRIDALADDARLRILRLIAEKGELRSQQIMDEIELSQSAASRQLSLLTAAGYLRERRCDGAKCYPLNTERVSDTLVSLANYLQISERSLL